MRGEGVFYFSNDFYLPSRRVGGGGSAPCGLCLLVITTGPVAVPRRLVAEGEREDSSLYKYIIRDLNGGGGGGGKQKGCMEGLSRSKV
jgi:hypothetical protein